MSERLILNNDSTQDTEPDVVMPRALAEWFAALVEAFPDYVRAQQPMSEESGE